MTTHLPDIAVYSAIVGAIGYVVVALIDAARPRKLWLPIALCVVGVVSNVVYGFGLLEISASIAVVFRALVWVLVLDRYRNDPRTLKALLGAKEAAWSRQRHDLVNDRLSAEGRHAALCERVRAHGLDPDAL